MTDGAAQVYAVLTVTALTISDATTSVTFGGAITATSAMDIDSGGTIALNAAVTASTRFTAAPATTRCMAITVMTA